MLMKFVRLKKAQSVTEYAILLGIVIGAFAGMQIYLKRGIQARVKTGTDAVTSSSATFTVGDYSTTFSSLSQYEPYDSESRGESYQESVKQQHMGDGKIAEEIVSEIAASAAGGYRADIAGKTVQDSRDKVWEGDEDGSTD